MERTLLTLLSISSLVVGDSPRAICPNSTIKAVEDANVSLPCHLDPPVNVSLDTVYWKRLHNKDDQYRNRTTLSHEDLSRGILTLLLSSVKLSDSGQYECFVLKSTTSCVINLVVEKDRQEETKRDDLRPTGPEEEATEPDGRDAAKMETVWKIVVPSVVGGVVVVAAVGVVLFLVKRGHIKNCMRRMRGQEAEMMQPNNSEMENLRTQTPGRGGEDPDRAAEDGLRQLVVGDDDHSSPQRQKQITHTSPV